MRKQLVYPIADPGSLRQHVVTVEDIRLVDPVAVGDNVQFVAGGDGSGMIVEVLPRRSKLVRRAAGTKPLEQVIVANVDQVIIICAADRPPPSWELVDRYLASAESTEVQARICITKIDLVEPGVLDKEVANYRTIGYPVDLTSANSGAGVEAFAEFLHDRLSVLAGKSGAGKTSLLNAVQPGLGLRVGAVSAMTGKGKHTTSYLEMFALDGGGGVVDTPGMREFGLWDVHQDDYALLFREFRPYLGTCRFGRSCRHRADPGCAITEAVAAGQITQRRYQSYLRLTM
ncbi:MAG: ribosome small subunit-dependent GTPase A [Chloroflexota bacterium]